jgi:hypothetical protein
MPPPMDARQFNAEPSRVEFRHDFNIEPPAPDMRDQLRRDPSRQEMMRGGDRQASPMQP